MCSGCPEEIVGLVQHAVFGKPFAEYLEIACFYNAGIFLHFLKVGIHTALSGFVSNHRYIDIRFFATVPVSRWLSFVYGNPSFRGDMRHIVLIRRSMSTCGRGAIEPSVIILLCLFYQIFQYGEVTFVFVAVTHQDERGVIAIGIENGIHLFFKEITPVRIFTHIFDPHGKFGLEVHTYFVTGFESGFRRTPGVKAYVIHSIFFNGGEDAFPVIHICRRITGQGKDCTIQYST